VQAGGVVGVGVAELHRDELVALQVDRVIGERFGEDEVVGEAESKIAR